MSLPKASDRSDFTSDHSSQLATAVYMPLRKNVFLLCSVCRHAWFAPVPGHFIHVNSLDLQEYKMSVRL